MNFTIFARGVCIYDSLNRQRVVDLGVPVEIDGVAFAAGDRVMADEDGLVVAPQAIEKQVVDRAWEKVHAENVTRDAIKAGMKTAAVYEKFGVLSRCFSRKQSPAKSAGRT